MEAYKSIIIIGPIAVGKNSIASSLGDRYGLDVWSGDLYQRLYTVQKGIPIGIWQRIYQERDLETVYRIKEHYYALMINDLLDKIENNDEIAVIHFGGNQTTFYNPRNFDLVNERLSNYENIVLLTPFADKEQSISYLSTPENIREKGWDFTEANRRIIECDSSERLAKKIIYTGNKVKKMVSAEIDKYLNEAPEMHKLLRYQRRNNRKKEKEIAHVR
jgi:cytidylate kinase